MNDTELRVLEGAWRTGQENARHFNEILVKMRAGVVLFSGVALTSLAALTDASQTIIGWALFATFGIMSSLYVLDRWYYHVLLLGTVTWLRSVEAVLFGSMRFVGLAEHVSQTYASASLFDDGRTGKPGAPEKAKTERPKSAADRVAIFYGVFMAASLGSASWLLASAYGMPQGAAVGIGLASLAVLVILLWWIERQAHGPHRIALPPRRPAVDTKSREVQLETFQGAPEPVATQD